jgi:hypothetical protein
VVSGRRCHGCNTSVARAQSGEIAQNWSDSGKIAQIGLADQFWISLGMAKLLVPTLGMSCTQVHGHALHATLHGKKLVPGSSDCCEITGS